MDNVLQVEIDPDIVLDESRIKDMPDDIKGRLLTTMTIYCEKYDCHWKDLTWRVNKDSVIYVDKRKTA